MTLMTLPLLSMKTEVNIWRRMQNPQVVSMQNLILCMCTTSTKTRDSKEFALIIITEVD